MPNYDYHCEDCDQTFEVFQSMNDKRLRKCPDNACGGKVTRLIGTGAGIIFKGGGFYETDYRSDSYKAGEKAAKEATTPGNSGDSKKSESKPAKSESKKAKKAE
ncbi:MAG: zinc ribbon domain-containing protein [Verrucomicrobiota bacterium]